MVFVLFVVFVLNAALAGGSLIVMAGLRAGHP